MHSPSSSDQSQKRFSPPAMVDSSPLTMDKNRESLKIKLMVRRSANQLVQQGILPDLKTSPAIHEQKQKLERAKTGDLLKAKIQQRPNREELERRHILESHEGHIDPSLADKYRMLEKAILVDQLNSKISHRPGPLELIEKNILHANEPIERIVKEGLVEYKLLSVDDSVVFEDDSQSSEGDVQPKAETILLATPNFIEQPASTATNAVTYAYTVIPKLTIKLPNDATTSMETFVAASNPPPPPPPLIINHPTTKIKEMPSLEPFKKSPPTFLVENNTIISTTNNNNNNNNNNIKSHISSFIQNNQKIGGTGKDKNRKKCKIKPTVKSKAIKFHEYKGPPNANKSSSSSQLSSSSSPSTSSQQVTLNKKVGETNYELIMQQQCLLEYLEGIYKNSKMDPDAVVEMQTNSTDKVAPIKIEQDASKKEDIKKPFVTIFPSKAPSNASNSSNGNANGVVQVKDTVISDFNQLSKLKVSELKAFLKKFSLPVSGPKPLLVERLKPYLPLKLGGDQPNAEKADEKEVKSLYEMRESPINSPNAMLIDAETAGEDIVREQQRKIEELQRKLQESQLELEQFKQIKHSDSFSSQPGGIQTNGIEEESSFFRIIPTNPTELQNNLIYDQKYQIASPLPTVFVVANVSQPSIVPVLLQQQQQDENVKSVESIDTSAPASVMMINDDDDETKENDHEIVNEVTSNENDFHSKNLPFNIMQEDDISDVLEILLKNEKWPESPSEGCTSKCMSDEKPVLQSNVLSSTSYDPPPSMNEPMSPLLASDVSIGKSPMISSEFDKSIDEMNCNGGFITDCPMDVEDSSSNMMIDSSNFSNFKSTIGAKKSPIHHSNNNNNMLSSSSDLNVGGSGGGVKNSLIGNFDNNLFDTFKNNNVSSNNNNLVNSSSFYNNTTSNNSHDFKDFKESDRNYMNNLNILNNFEIFSNTGMELAVPMDFENIIPYDIYQQDTFFNNISNTLQNSSHDHRDGAYMGNNSAYFNSSPADDIQPPSDMFSEVVDNFLESVTEKV